MKTILLDLDDTILLSGGIHPRINELLSLDYNFILFSASEDIENWAKYFKIQFRRKDQEGIAQGDILIDDTKEFFHKSITNATKYYKSIDDFFISFKND